MSRSFTKPAIAGLVRPVRRKATCRNPASPISQVTLLQSSRAQSTSDNPPDNEELYGNRGRELREGPRWQSTPPRMRAPVRSKPPVPNNDFAVNDDPKRLDKVYEQVLGIGGDSMLSEEVKWLAVTHKSFDHGKRGYNDRLAYLGRRIFEMQLSLSLIHRSSTTKDLPKQDQYGRDPFQHSALDGLDSLTEHAKSSIATKSKLAALAESYGLDMVLRWKPKKMTNLQGSGLPIVSAQALYAIVGAVALQKGGEVANSIARQRILEPLGFQ